MKTRQQLRQDKKWYGYNGGSVKESIMNYGFAIRYKDYNFRDYECYLPDPEYDDCCVHLDSIDSQEVYHILTKRRDVQNFMAFHNMFLSDLHDLTMDDLLMAVAEFYDVVDFFGLGGDDAEAIERQDIVDSMDDEGNEIK